LRDAYISRVTPDRYVAFDAVADGYWVLIEDLPAGEHEITIVGKQHGQTSTEGKWDVKSQVTYHLTVSTLTHPSKSGPPSPLSCLRHHQFVLGQCLSVEIDP
jgi:hypothetical protein